jgi:membrane protein
VARSAATVLGTLKKIPARLREHNTTLVAAGVAFYGFLAFIPALIAFISVYGLFADPADVKQQVEDVASALPKEVQSFLVFQLDAIVKANTAEVSVTLVVAVVIALWSASGGMAALVTGINVSEGRAQPKSFVVRRGKALGLTVGAIAFVGIVMFLTAVLPPLISDTGDAGRIGVEILRWPILAVVMVVGIGLLYRFSTEEHPRAWLGFVTTGSVIATIGWLIVSALFSVYTANFAGYAKTYGSLASIVVLLIWIWLSSLLVLIGAEYDGASTT